MSDGGAQDPDPPARQTGDAAATPEQLAERRQRANRAILGVLAAILCLEAFCVLLVPRAIAQTATGLGTVRTVVLIALAAVLVAVGFLLRRPWGIAVGSAMQLAFLATAVWVPLFVIVGVIFVAVWLYLLNLRHELVGTPGGLRMLVS